jgi:hypothetical protein
MASAFPTTGRPLPPRVQGAGGNVQNNKTAYSFTDRQKLWVAAGGNPSKSILAAAVSMGNAQAAVAISKNGTDWRPWTTFRSGAYIPFMHRANAFPDPSSDVTGAVGAAVGAAGAVVSPIAGIAKFVSRLNVLFELDWWKRVGMVIIGLVAILLGVTWAAKEFMPQNLPVPPIIP